MLKPDSLRFVGRNMRRPESVLCTSRGDIFASHLGSGILQIEATGNQRILGNISLVDSQPWIPNGIALLPDHTFLVANMGEGGGVWRLHDDGRHEAHLLEVDGVHIRPANFVLVDEKIRIWITVSTRNWPAAVFDATAADGFIVLVDDTGARIVADGLKFANELRLDASGEHLYVVETFGRRVTRFRIGSNGDLTGREVFATFGFGTFPDGIAFDCEGCLWVVSIVSNRVIRIDPNGRQTTIVEEADEDHITHIEQLLESGTLTRSDILNTPAGTLKNISSIAFGGPNLRTVYLGSLNGDRLVVFDAPVPGLPPAHWGY